MNIDSINNHTSSDGQISSEQHPSIENHQGQNSTQNDTKSKEVVNGINKRKKSPMTPTPLEYSWWSTYPVATTIGAVTFFTIIIIIVGILIICLTQPKPAGKSCAFVLKSLARNLINNDSRPHSIAIGDFNNDSLPDIVVANSGTNNIGVFLRHDNGTFTDQMTYSTGFDSTPYAVSVADFNNDRRLDIAVTNFGTHNIGIFLGIGNGTFRPQATFSTGSSRPRWIAVGNLNNDTQLDIAVVNDGTNTIGVFLQDINGSFANQTTFSTGYDSDPYSLAIGDLNNDNKLDIVVANYGTNNVGVFSGLGNGTFATRVTFTTGINSHPYSVAIDNINSDTHLDIVVACYGTNNIAVLLGYGNGTFTMPMMYSTGNNSSPRSIIIADLDNDNKLDIAVASYGTTSVDVLLGDGNGIFSDQNRTFFNSPNFNPYSIAIGDFNADNRSDIAVVNYDFNYVDIILNYRNYSFSKQTAYPTGSYSSPLGVAVVDFNDDLRLDIAVANFGSNTIGVFLGYGNGTFSSQTTYFTGSDSGPWYIAVDDFNNDNRLDIVVANYMADNIGIFLGYGNGTFSNQTIYPTGNGSRPCAVVVGDFNNDNQLDVGVTNYGISNVGIFLGYGNGTFSSQVTYSTGSDSGPDSIAVGDFNNDSSLDIVVANLATDSAGVFLGHGDGTFSNQTIYPTLPHSEPYGAAVGDLNNDGRLDLVVILNDNAGFIVLLGYGNGTFSPQRVYSTGSVSYPCGCVLGDVNNDNRLDVAVSVCGNGNVVVWLGNGDGSFFNERSYSSGDNTYLTSIAFGDFNNDSILDIVVANYLRNAINVFLGITYINGVREGTCSTGSSPHPQAVALSDFNNDAHLDIVVANSWLANVEVLLGNVNMTFSMQTMLSTGALSIPTSVVIGDFNNDSELDIVVASSGTGTVGVLFGYGNSSFGSQKIYSTGSGSSQKSVAVGDLNNDKRLDIVVADSGTNSVLTLLKYDPGAFGTQTMYFTGTASYPASVAVGDFNKDDRLDFVVTIPDKSNVDVFLGSGNGTFSRHATYSTGTDSLSRCIAVADFNNDSHLDIVVSNFRGCSIGIFLGFGNGTFSNQTTYSSLCSDGTGPYFVAVGDLNNDRHLDIVVANTGDSIGIFHGYGDGTFSNQTTFSTGGDSHPVSVAVADFNNDSRLDIIVANHADDSIGIFYGYGDGTFSDMITYSNGRDSGPTSVAVADFNNDNQLDVAVANFGTNTIGVRFGTGNGTFSSQMTFSTGIGSTPFSIAICDFNNDNYLDIAVANYGSNSFGVLLGYVNGTFFSQLTYLTGDGSQPLTIAVGDFNNDSRLDIQLLANDIINVRLTLSSHSFVSSVKEEVILMGRIHFADKTCSYLSLRNLVVPRAHHEEVYELVPHRQRTNIYIDKDNKYR